MALAIWDILEAQIFVTWLIIENLHCLCNILVVKFPKIKVCNPSSFKETLFGTSLRKQVLFEIKNYVFFFIERHL